MFSSFTISIIAIILLLCGCAKENHSKVKPVKVELKGNCESLSKIGEQLTRFAKGQLTNQEISDVWRCANKSVSDFDRITGGDLQGGDYSPEAVRHFFEVYFLANKPVSDELLASMMEIKRVLVSGSITKITRAELSKLQSLVEILREASIGLNPYARVAFMVGDEASDEEILSANQAFDIAIQRLGQWLGEQNQDYSFASARRLIRGLQKWMNDKGKDSEILANFDKAFEVVPSLKQLLLSGQKDGIKGGEWTSLARALGQTHSALLALKFSFTDNMIAGLNRGAVPHGVERFVEVLDSARLRHPKKEIPLVEWSEFFEKIEETKWLSEEFTKSAMDNAFSWVVNRLFSSKSGREETSLRAEHFNVIRRHLGIWKSLRAHVLTPHAPKNNAAFARKFDEVLSASVPAEWDRQGRLLFSGRAPAAWSTDSKLNMLWPYVVINWLKESFVGEAPESMNNPQMLAVGKEILPVLQKFNWFKSTKDTIGAKLLREADVFTAGSNGNLTLEVKEATRYLAFVASSFRAAQVWIEQTKNICPTRDAVCMRKAATDTSLDILTPMPHVRSLVKANPAKLFNKYSRAAEETIIGQPVQGTFGTADLLQAWMIFQYVETFDQHFDADQNGVINLAEGQNAYTLFGPMLTSLLKPKGFPPDEVPVFFTFLLKFGDTPFTMLGGGVAYNWWTNHPNEWVLESNRQTLVDVLKQLSKL